MRAQPVDELAPLFWGVACLLVFAPLIQGGHSAGVMIFLLMGVAALFGFQALWSVRKGTVFLVWSSRDLLFLPALGWLFFSLRRATAPPEAFESFLFFLACLGLFFLTRTLSFAGKGRALAVLFSCTAGFLILAGLLQLAGVLPHGWWNPRRFLASTFVNHNHLAAYLELAFPVALLVGLNVSRPAERFLLLASSALAGIGLLITGSRGAWLSFLIAGGITALLGKRSSARKIFTGAWVTVAAAAIFLMAQPSLSSRLFSLLDVSEDASARMRLGMWRGTVALIRENPLWGRGLGSFVGLFPLHRPAGLTAFINYAHNEYLQLFAELGLVGFLLAVTAVIFPAKEILELGRKSETPWKRAAAWGGWTGLLSVALHAFVDFPWHIPAVLFLTAALGGFLTGIPYEGRSFPLQAIKLSGHPRWAAGVAFACLLFSVALSPLAAADLLAFKGKWGRAAALAPHRVFYREKQGEYWGKSALRFKGYERKKRLEKAESVYRRALSKFPSARLEYVLGNTLLQLGKLDEAETRFNHAVQKDPQNPVYWKSWGEVLLIRGDIAAARLAFRRAVDLSLPFNFFPEMFRPLTEGKYFVEAGERNLDEGRILPAKRNFSMALEIDPQSQEARAGLASVELRAGNPAESAVLIAGITEITLKAEWLAEKAYSEFRKKEFAGALQAAEEALRADPANFLAHQIRLLSASRQAPAETAQYQEALLALNHSPVFPGKSPDGKLQLIWEPEKGKYTSGKRSPDGWLLYSKGSLGQHFFLPPGKYQISLRASGSRAAGHGPAVKVDWSGRTVLGGEIAHKNWQYYESTLEVKPGDSKLELSFVNDYRDPVTGEDRNLRIEKVMIWKK